MQKALFLLLAMFCIVSIQAQTRVVLLGTFHFDNPGLDVAKFDDANILSPKRQSEVTEVIEKLKVFRPTKIFVEYPVESQQKVDSDVMKYKAGKLQQDASEINQLAYRLAKELNLHTVYAVDYRKAAFPFDSLVKEMVKAQQFDLLAFVKQQIDSIQTSFNASLKTLSLKDLLIQANNETSRQLQVGGYYQFLVAGDINNHVGAYLTSEWWRRNMIIYSNILKRLQPTDERILIIFGSGHTALLHEMMQYNSDLQIIPLKDVLQ